MARDQVFISYSHRDKKWLSKLQVVLAPLTSKKTITVWADTEIRPGERWQQEIAEALDATSVAVLLVSQHFLASDFIARQEVPALLTSAEKGGVKILWVAVSASLYETSAVAQYQAANDPARPLDSLSPSAVNKELVEIARKIWEAVRSSEANSPPPLHNAPVPPVSPRFQAPDWLRRDTAACVGRTVRGPSTPVLISDWDEYRRTFGPPTDPAFSVLGYCARGFFENGGRDLYIMRIAGQNATVACLRWSAAPTAVQRFFIL